MKGVGWKDLDVLTIEAQEQLSEEELHANVPPLSNLFTLAPRAHIKTFMDNVLPIVLEGGWLGTLFEPSTRGPRTF